ncbi:MAG: hypothetical protein M3Z13_03170 [Candidatus Dormibacteraeota bacterium]|nr:hypothetical protein [Candidatus Dormibacteraeota bacterium]
MIEEANLEIWRAVEDEIHRRADRVRIRALIAQIDELFWELEDLNLRNEKSVPRGLWNDVAAVVATCFGTRPENIPVRRSIGNALDVLYEAQASLIADRREMLGLVIVENFDDGESSSYDRRSREAIQLFA